MSRVGELVFHPPACSSRVNSYSDAGNVARCWWMTMFEKTCMQWIKKRQVTFLGFRKTLITLKCC